jgi:hypothetical protein
MVITPEQLRKHYASLSDDELLAMNRDDLTDVAVEVYDLEMKRRALTPVEEEEPIEEDHSLRLSSAESNGETEEYDSGGDKFVAGSFIDSRGNSSAADAEDARRALQAANIPCELEVQDIPAHTTYTESQVAYHIVVPAEFTLQATSVLDKEVFNPKIAEEWETHLSGLTDNQLHALNVDSICAGLLDRAERLRKAYTDEIRRRQPQVVN